MFYFDDLSITVNSKVIFLDKLGKLSDVFDFFVTDHFKNERENLVSMSI
jgi:hypothetical protein